MTETGEVTKEEVKTKMADKSDSAGGEIGAGENGANPKEGDGRTESDEQQPNEIAADGEDQSSGDGQEGPVWGIPSTDKVETQDQFIKSLESMPSEHIAVLASEITDIKNQLSQEGFDELSEEEHSDRFWEIFKERQIARETQKEGVDAQQAAERVGEVVFFLATMLGKYLKNGLKESDIKVIIDAIIKGAQDYAEGKFSLPEKTSGELDVTEINNHLKDKSNFVNFLGLIYKYNGKEEFRLNLAGFPKILMGSIDLNNIDKISQEDMHDALDVVLSAYHNEERKLRCIDLVKKAIIKSKKDSETENYDIDHEALFIMLEGWSAKLHKSEAQFKS